MEKYCRAGQATMTIWRIRIVWWIPKATEPPSEYVIPIAFTLQHGYMNAPQ